MHTMHAISQFPPSPRRKPGGALAVVFLLAASANAQPLPFTGTWLFPPVASPQASYIVNGIYHCPSCASSPLSFPADGQDHPIEGNPLVDSMRVTVDGLAIKVDRSKAGKLVSTVRVVAEPGGKHSDIEITDYIAGPEPKIERARRARVGRQKPGYHPTSGPWRVIAGSGAFRNAEFEQTATGLKYRPAFEASYVAQFDGRQYPMEYPAGKPIPDLTVTIRKINDRTIEEQFFTKGQPDGRTRMTVSRDGRRLTNLYWDKDGRKTKTVATRKQ